MTGPKLSFLALVLTLAVLGAACGSDDGVKIEGPGGGGVKIGEGGVTVEGPSGGEVNVGTGDYPEGWPTDFPVPDGASPVYSVGAAGSVSVWFGTDQSADDVKAFYTTALPEAGYTIDSQTDFTAASGGYSVIATTGNGWTGGIYMGAGAGAIAAGFQGDFDFWVSLTPAS